MIDWLIRPDIRSTIEPSINQSIDPSINRGQSLRQWLNLKRCLSSDASSSRQPINRPIALALIDWSIRWFIDALTDSFKWMNKQSIKCNGSNSGKWQAKFSYHFLYKRCWESESPMQRDEVRGNNSDWLQHQTLTSIAMLETAHEIIYYWSWSSDRSDWPSSRINWLSEVNFTTAHWITLTATMNDLRNTSTNGQVSWTINAGISSPMIIGFPRLVMRGWQTTNEWLSEEWRVRSARSIGCPWLVNFLPNDRWVTESGIKPGAREGPALSKLSLKVRWVTDERIDPRCNGERLRQRWSEWLSLGCRHRTLVLWMLCD